MKDISYRKVRNYENQQRMIFDGVGDFGIPTIEPCVKDLSGLRWVAFNCASKEKKPWECVCHFFIDDYRFLRFWNNPGKYIPMLSRFAAVTAPDFSLYVDFPRALQIYNHFRKHWLAHYMQEEGITVVPSIGWSDEESFKYCFDGEPLGSVVAIANTGCIKVPETRERFARGYDEMMARIEPRKVWLYGQDRFVPENAEVVSNEFLDRMNAAKYNRKEETEWADEEITTKG